MHVLLTYAATAGEDGLDVRGLVSSFEAAGHDVDAQSLAEDGWKSAVGVILLEVAAPMGSGPVTELSRSGGDRVFAARVPKVLWLCR